MNGGVYVESSEKTKAHSLSMILMGTAIICLLIGGILGYAISSFDTSSQISGLQSNVSTLQKQVSDLQPTNNSTSGNVTYANYTYENVTYVLGGNVSLPQLYNQVRDSIVMVQGIVLAGYDFFGNPSYGGVEGSGFVSNRTGQFVIITNYHVVQDALNITVTFTDGNTYAANVTGRDPYEDLAVLSTKAPQNEYEPLNITSSSKLQVGDPVFAVGNPLGYTGSLTSGIVSALGRTVSVSWSSYSIADCIQTTTPINPGNSGGPLLNYAGEVVGITSYTALTSQGVAAQGLGLAIPSSAILRETPSLIANGSYTGHPWLGASGTNMDFDIAQAMNTNVTYGWLISQVTSGGPTDTSGLKGGSTQFLDISAGTYVMMGGDIITAINNTKITNGDALSSFLEEFTQPGQTINVMAIRNNQTINAAIKLGTRPPPSA
jgi:S1-C subfamily serine protease